MLGFKPTFAKHWEGEEGVLLLLCQPQILLGPNIAWLSLKGEGSGVETSFMTSSHGGGLDKIHRSCHGWLHLLVPRPGIIKILRGRAWEKADAD